MGGSEVAESCVACRTNVGEDGRLQEWYGTSSRRRRLTRRAAAGAGRLLIDRGTSTPATDDCFRSWDILVSPKLTPVHDGVLKITSPAASRYRSMRDR